jgi:hypothetical protein
VKVAQVLAFIILDMLKILRVLKLNNLLNRAKELIVTDCMEIAFKAFKLMITIYLLAHWIACSFWVVGITQIST